MVKLNFEKPTMTIRFSKELGTRLTALHKKTMIPKIAIIRKALEELLKREENK